MSCKKSHDLSLGKWGPYNKEFYGAAHIANEQRGAVFVVEPFPAFYRRRVVSATTLMESDVRMWGANASRTAFVYRYELEWRDRVYCDVKFNITDDSLVNIDCEFVNNTDTPQSVNLFLAVGMEYPTNSVGAVSSGNYKEVCEAKYAEGCVVIDAVDYADIACAQSLAQDGKYLGEAECNFATGMGTLISGAHFFSDNHFLKYSVNEVKASNLGIRYRASESTNLLVNIDGSDFELVLNKSTDFSYAVLSFGEKSVSEIVIKPVGSPIDIDCLIVGDNAPRVEFSPCERAFKPVEKVVDSGSMTLKYKDSRDFYKIEWDDEPLMLRTLYTDDVGHLLHKSIHDHVSTERYDSKASEGVYEIVRTKPVYLEPHTRSTVSFRVISSKSQECNMPTKKQADIFKVASNEGGKKYAFSQNVMAYNTLLNVVYPIYTRRGYIRHSAPGRIWNCLYTWDSGFIGMGLSTVDFQQAYENLYAYLTPVGDKHSPYIFHGSLVPTQIFLYHELINKFPQNRAKLLEIYPMVMQYYGFFSNLCHGEEQTKSGILKGWHIFYNSGGWDDYPAQKHVRYESAGKAEKNNSMTTPVITTALVVLIAKIMKNASHVLGIFENDSLFDADIEKYSRLIQDNLWDEEAGYYSYLVHDEEGNPKGFLRYKDGTNYNCGLDGAYPYIAGISDEHQSAVLLDNIKNGMMTKYGLGVVDTRAPYYEPYGYWNGSVWMPHQWILFKALLDRGEVRFAAKIAKTALNVWKTEVERSYLCFEHFMSVNGRGAGFHQFSGLSTPVLMFFESLYKQGAVTGGFCTVIKTVKTNDTKSEMHISAFTSESGSSVIVTLNAENKYTFLLNGKKAKAIKLTDGAYAIALGSSGEKQIDIAVQK
jgi:hypothetical protein